MCPGLPVEVEVDSLDQLDEVLDAGADLVLLDNMTPPTSCARRSRRTAGRARLEATGGLTLDGRRAGRRRPASTIVSVGALTHSAPVLDIGAWT